MKCSMERVVERKRAEAMRPRGSLSLAASFLGASVEVVGEVLIPDGDESLRGTVERVPSGLIRSVVCGVCGSLFEVRIGGA